MSYTPNNPNIFNAAYTGCMYGIAANQAIVTDSNESDYVNPAIISGAFAIAVDTAWGAVGTNQLDTGVIQGACVRYWSRSASPANLAGYALPETWTQAAEAIIAMVDAAEAYFSAQGITPLPLPGGPSSVSLTGDVTGVESAGVIPTTIEEIQGIPVALGSPSTGQVLTYNGTDIVPENPASSTVTLGGDVSGTGPTGSTIITTITATGVTAGSYGSSSQSAQLTVNAKGQVTAAVNVTIDATLTGDVTGSGAVTGIATSLGYPVLNVAASGTLTLSRNRLQTAIVTGAGATVNFPSAPITDDVVNVVLAFTGSGASTSVTNGGGSANIEPPLVIGTFAASVTLVDAGGVYSYQYNGTNWVLKTTNSTLPSFKGPNSPPDNGSWSVTTWFIDPQNTSGNASDSNSGTNAGNPLLTKKELFRRWGTWSPVLDGSVTPTVTVTYQSPDTTGNDPGLFAPILKNGAQFIETAVLPAPSFVGTINSVTSTNTGANQIFNLLFNVTSGAVAANMLLVNLTRGNSRAFVQRQLSSAGNPWQTTQPYTPFAGSGISLPSAVNTWAAGDAIQGYMLTHVNTIKVGGQQTDVGAGFAAYFGHVVWNLTFWNPQTADSGNVDFFSVDGSCDPLLIECAFGRSSYFGGSYGIETLIFNCAIYSADCDCRPIPVSISGGFANGLQMRNGNISGNMIIASTAAMTDCAFGADVAADTGATVAIIGTNSLMAAGGILYGPGTWNVQGTLTCGASANFETIFPGNLELNKSATGYSMKTTAGVTAIAGGIAVTGVNLAAAAGPGGFGGTATNLAGASITNGAQP